MNFTPMSRHFLPPSTVSAKQPIFTPFAAAFAMICLIAAMTSGEAVMLGGLGTFKVSKRNERKGRNPQTGKDIVVPASMVPKFTPARALKEAVAKMPLKEDA